MREQRSGVESGQESRKKGRCGAGNERVRKKRIEITKDGWNK